MCLRTTGEGPRARSPRPPLWQRRRCGLELPGQRVGGAREQTDVGADRHEAVAPVDVAADLVFVAAQNAGRLAYGLETRGRLSHRRLHVRMLRMTEMAERGRQVGRSDEHAVDTLHRGDRLELI